MTVQHKRLVAPAKRWGNTEEDKVAVDQHSYTVGILEDEEAQSTMLAGWLTDHGYQVFCCGRADEFIELVKSRNVDLVVLDWLLPDSDGLQVLLTLKKELDFQGSILFATQLDTERHIVEALDAGADDYLVKPLREREFIARLSALKRRSNYVSEQKSVFEAGPIRLDMLSRTAYVSGEVIKLTPKEFELAACMLSQKGQLLSREYLLDKVWGVNADIDTRTVDMHVSRIRRALSIGPETGFCIKTVYQHGYRFEELLAD